MKEVDIMEGKLIVIEGPDGSGKSTQIRLMKEYLAAKGFEVVETREPGGTRIGEKIRDIILDRDNTEMNPVTEALLYAASRAQHVHEVIKPEVMKGKIVICTRYVYSSLVYQGIARGLGIETVASINDAAIQGVRADLTLLFDMDPEKALRRKTSGGKGDRLELEDVNFHKMVYNGYKEIAKSHKDIKTIDASRSVEEVHKEVIDIINKFLNLKG
jgi:thymidylate kinase